MIAQTLEDEEESATPGGGPDFVHMVAQASDLSQRRTEFVAMFVAPQVSSMSGPI